MKVYTSAWVVPISSPPIRRGAVAVAEDRIVAVGPAVEVLHAVRSGLSGPESARPEIDLHDLGDAVLLPAFVNAHTHLELSWMAGEALPRGDFLAWVRAMIARLPPSERDVEVSIARALEAMRASGTALVGDVGNTLAGLAFLRASEMPGRFFLELIGARADRAREILDEAERRLDSPSPGHAPGATGEPRNAGGGRSAATITASLAPHGPHSVSPELLGLLGDRARARGDRVSVHLAESRAEVDLLLRGEGPFRPLLEEIGAIDRSWKPPGRRPAEILDSCGLLGPRTLAVHGVHLTRPEARLIAARGATLVLCPRSNARLAVGAAPIAMLLEEGVRLALGTDSLASNDDLDIRAELASLRALAPGAAPDALVRAATLGGAEALGFGDDLGSIAPGKRAVLVALRRESVPGARGERWISGSEPARSAHLQDDAALAAEPYATVFADAGDVRITRLDPAG